jgi:pimeloyl-ACP methyl ester carboxylesterase
LRADVDGSMLHLVEARGRGPRPLPLLLTHGWPGSFLEYIKLVPLLSDPGAHGADPADAFTMIVPSLPGYGFSGPPPPTGLTGRDVARLWHALMTAGLGHDRYVAHGSDLGAGVTGWLARDQPHAVAGIHLATPGLAVRPGPRSTNEDEFAAAVKVWTAAEGGYMHEHATKPGTLGAALSDSPAGLAAWIAEKIVAWSSRWPDAHNHVPGAGLPAGDPSPVPTAVTIFGGESIPFPKPPRELAERYYNVTEWAEHPVGGHFPAVAEPELLARVLRDTFRPMRTRA